jgi:hypothetical protein
MYFTKTDGEVPVGILKPGDEAGESINQPANNNGGQKSVRFEDPPTEEEINPFPAIVANQEAEIYAAGEIAEAALPPDPDPDPDPGPDGPDEPVIVDPPNPEFTEVRRSSRVVNPTVRLIETCKAVIDVPELLSNPERNYYSALLDNEPELCLLGAALGGGFQNTAELRPMKYGPAMEGADKLNWSKAVDEEYERMVEHGVFQPVPRSEVPAGAKIITSTWAMKKKSNGTFRARVNGRGYEQVDGEHYDEDSIASPTVNITSFRIVLVLMLMMNGYAHLVDVNGAFLLGGWEKDPVTNEERKVYMEIPEGFHKFFGTENLVLRLLKTIYGTKQAAKRFWLFLLGVLRVLGFEYNRADPCVYFKWTAAGLVIWLSWVDDCLCVGPKSEVLKAKSGLTGRLKCDDAGEMKEYVGCKIQIDRNLRSAKITQPVLIQSLSDEFELDLSKKHRTPAVPNLTLQKTEDGPKLDEKDQSLYRKGVGKLIHMMRWSRPDVLNATREVSRFGQGANPAQAQALTREMEYCVQTPERGLLLKPTGVWDGKDKSYKFVVKGVSDSEFAKDIATRRSVGGHTVYLCGAPVMLTSKMQRIVAASVTEAELIEGCDCAQDMMYVMRLMTYMKLQVELPMLLYMDNQGAIDIINNWSSTGRTRHMDTKVKFARELKEANIMKFVWVPTKENETDTQTKNLHGPDFEKCNAKYVGVDKYSSGGQTGVS